MIPAVVAQEEIDGIGKKAEKEKHFFFVDVSSSYTNLKHEIKTRRTKRLKKNPWHS